MPRKNLNYQLKSNGTAPLDYKETPLKKMSELNDIPLSDRFLGMTVTVLDAGDGKPADYWFIGDNLYSAEWKKKTFGEEDGSAHVINGVNSKNVDVIKTDESGEKKGELVIASDNVKIAFEDTEKGNTGIILGNSYGKDNNALLYSKSTFPCYTKAEIATTFNIHLIKQLIGKKLRYNKCSGELIPSHSTLQSGLVRLGDFAYVGIKSRGCKIWNADNASVTYKINFLDDETHDYFYFQLALDAILDYPNKRICINKSAYEFCIEQLRGYGYSKNILMVEFYGVNFTPNNIRQNKAIFDISNAESDDNYYYIKLPTLRNSSYHSDEKTYINYGCWNEVRFYTLISTKSFGGNAIVSNRCGDLRLSRMTPGKWVKVLRHNMKYRVNYNAVSGSFDEWEPQNLNFPQLLDGSHKKERRTITLDNFCLMVAKNTHQVWMRCNAVTNKDTNDRGNRNTFFTWRPFAKLMDGRSKTSHLFHFGTYRSSDGNFYLHYDATTDTYSDKIDLSSYIGCLLIENNNKYYDKYIVVTDSAGNAKAENFFDSDYSCDTVAGVRAYLSKLLKYPHNRLPKDYWKHERILDKGFYYGKDEEGNLIETDKVGMTIRHDKMYLDFAVFEINHAAGDYNFPTKKLLAERVGSVYRLTYDSKYGNINNQLTYLGVIAYFKNRK